ncbi:hypothetical protein DSECCO2_513990 [anaerobic digester metagenome]
MNRVLVAHDRVHEVGEEAVGPAEERRIDDVVEPVAREVRFDPLDDLDGLEDELDLDLLSDPELVGKLRELLQKFIYPVRFEQFQVATGLVGLAEVFEAVSEGVEAPRDHRKDPVGLLEQIGGVLQGFVEPLTVKGADTGESLRLRFEPVEERRHRLNRDTSAVTGTAEVHRLVSQDPPDPSHGCEQRRLIPPGNPGDPGACGEEEVADEEETAEPDAYAVGRVPGGVINHKGIPGAEGDRLPAKGDPAAHLKGLAVAGGKQREIDRERLDLPPHEFRSRPDSIARLKHPGSRLLCSDGEARDGTEPSVPDGLVAVVDMAMGEEEGDRPRGFSEGLLDEQHEPIHLAGVGPRIDDQDIAGCPDDVGVRAGDVRFPEEGIDLCTDDSGHRLPSLIFKHSLRLDREESWRVLRRRGEKIGGFLPEKRWPGEPP